ncbi:hypothetical protein P171DRAFT_470126 [Karstenula rhodostoma CBS 690.94]|uniref:SAP domain-containing protein n=1 Tax=Karstenula rhodostoma CBS 690.94 TaxID=1392251 RepID=A0A9P4PSV4_9PLEO|nr:hypothetical protein P171DRAFT_470126 [Karstenula rhodostoma CBS 690.94]
MAWHTLFEQLYWVDDRFNRRFHAKPVYNDVRLQILLYAGRQASASFSVAVACVRTTAMHSHGYSMVEVAEQGMLYEPFTYWDWHGYDADGKPLEGRYLHEGGRKKRLLWERERAFKANQEKQGDLTPRERWEGFKKFVERKQENGSFVNRIAVANWMTKGDMEWIAKNLTRLEALDLSDVPSSYGAGSVQNDNTWLGYLRENIDREPVYIENLYQMFPSLKGVRDNSEYEEGIRLADLYEHRYDYAYKTAVPPSSFQHREPENFEEWFWRLQKRTEEKLTRMEEEIAETHLWRRLKWLGLPDWRSNNYAAKTVGSTIPPWCVSMKTVSIRGEYTRDRSSKEFESIHHHVCQLILGIERIVPASVTKLELRLSVSFLRYFLEQLGKTKPSIKRVGIDLGAWVQVFPLGKPPEHLKDEDIRATTRQLARNVPNLKMFHQEKGHHRIVQDEYAKEEAYEAEQEYVAKQPSFYRNRSGNFELPHPLRQAPQPQPPVESTPAEYEFFKDLLYDRTRQDDACPLDHSKRHSSTKAEVERTRANTLAKLLEKLHLARRKVGDAKNLANVNFRLGKPQFWTTREGAELFGLPGEAQTRSFDPIDPLTLTQQEVKADINAGADYKFFNPEGLKAVYPWLEDTFKWRPVFDWDWFMVPQNMSVTENPNLVTINRGGKGHGRPADWQLEGKQADGRGTPGKELERTLGNIKKQFGLLNEAHTPVHLLIGRRDPDVSSCYWGWPYTKKAWKEWNEQFFSANLETIAEHVDTLSIMYDLRNPINTDRLSLIDVTRPYHPPNGKCPTRVCLLEKHNNGKCPFIEKYPGQRNKHPRPQVKLAGKPQSKKHMAPAYNGLADNGSFGPPTGERADDEAKEDDSDDEEVFPLRLARRSVYLRETVGWIRFWEAYGTSFTKLTALHVRMPHCHDNIRSWRLARLLNRRNGWHMITYTDERQHMQTEEDLLTTFDGESPTAPSKKVWWHLKESRVWPAGRFVRRSWIWEPLRLVERYEVITAQKEGYKAGDKDKHEYVDEDEEPEYLGKRYLVYHFEPRKKMGMDSHDNNVEVGEIECLREARREVELAVAKEEANGDPRDDDGLPIKLDRERIPRPDRLPHQITGFAGKFKSVYGHHIRNVAGAQWCEELREMITFMDSERLKRRGGLPRIATKHINEVLGESEEEFSDNEEWADERARLKELLAKEPPYGRIFEVKDDKIALRDVPVKEWHEDNDNDNAGSDTALPTANTQTEPDSTDNSNSDAPPLPGIALPGDSEADTEVDSLFGDSEPEDITQLPSSLPTSTSAQRKSSAEKASSGHNSSSPPTGPKKPPVIGPFDQSSSDDEDDGDDAKKPQTPPSIRIPLPENPPEGVVRTPRTPIDENYSDNDDSSDGGKPTDTEVVCTSGEQSGLESGQGKAVQTKPKSKVEKILESSKTKTKPAAGAQKEQDEEGTGEAIPALGGAIQGTAPGSSTKRKRLDTTPETTAPNKKPKVSTSASEKNTATKRKSDEITPDAPASNKKQKTSEARDDTHLSSAPASPPTAHPQKRKQPSPPTAPPSKKTKTTKSGRLVKQIQTTPLSDDDGETSDDAQKHKTKRSHSKTDYVPSPTENQASAGAGESGAQDKAKKAKSKVTAAAAPLAANAGGIQVPSKASGEPDYDGVTVVKLRALAKERALKLTGASRKADIVRRFEEDDARRRGGGHNGGGAGGGGGNVAV